jgi:denticleless
VENFCCHREDEVFLHGGITGSPVPPFACQFSPAVPYSHILAVADEEGSLRLLNTRKYAAQSLVKELSTHSNAIFDITWKPGGEQIVTASGDTTIGQWDVVRGESVATYKSHTGSVKSVDVKRDEPTMLVSGGRDGSIYVWDTRCSSRGSRHRPVNHVRMAHRWTGASPPAKKRRCSVTKTAQTTDLQYGVTSVLFHGLHKVASCGAADGSVKLWDLRRTYSICRLEPPLSWHSFSPVGESGRRFGFTSLTSDPWQSSLFASCTNDIIYQYSSSMLKSDPVGAYGGHKNSTFYVKSTVSPEGKYLLSGSSCSRAFIWYLEEPHKPPTVLNGHSKEVTAVCWSPALTEVVTCSDNNDLRLWRIRQSRNNAPVEDLVGTAGVYHGEGKVELRKAHFGVPCREPILPREVL